MNTVVDYYEFAIVRRLIPEERLDEVREGMLKIIESVSKEYGVRDEYDEFYAIDTITENTSDLIYKIFKEKVREVRSK
jgi:succinyl-diaminopimelate desuccinylase